MIDRLSEVRVFYSEIMGCTRCPLSKYRTQVVTGDGGYRCPILLLGEAPGRTEDALGKPFTGRAGKLLDDLLKKAGISREYVFIVNSVKCRPPRNRKPYKSEIIVCSAHLKREIEILAPKVIVSLGATGLQALSIIGLLKSENEVITYNTVKLKGLRKRRIELQIDKRGILVVPTYHPAACLRNPFLVKEMLEDLRWAAGEACSFNPTKL